MNRVFLRLFLFAAFAASVSVLSAQTAANYVFSTSTGATLDPMTGSAQLIGASVDDGVSAVTNIGFPFVYESTTYTQFSVSSNGLIRLGFSVVSADFGNALSDNSDNPKIMPIWDDISTGTGGSVRYVVTGTAPDRILKIQHYGRMDAAEGSASNSTFQVWFYECSNVIEFIYGTGSNPPSATIGIAGVTHTNYMARNHLTNHTAASTGGLNTIATWPGSGRKYTFTPPAANFRACFYAMNISSTNWCAGEVRNVTVSVKNTGTSTWTNSGPDINIGAKWNAETDHNVRVDANNLAPGSTATYTLTMTAPGVGSNNLGFDVVNEGNCWFRNNPGTCGAGTATGNMNAGTSPSTNGTAYLSPTLTIATTPSQPSVISGATAPCVGTTQTYSVTNVAGVTYTWTLPSGWSGSSSTNSITVTVGAASGSMVVTPSNSCGNGPARSLAVSPVATPANNLCSNGTVISAGGSLGGSLTCSSFESPFTSYNDVWYRFTAPCAASFTATLSGLPDDKDLSMFTACGTTSATASSTNSGTTNETITWTSTAGTTYYFRVYDYAGTGGGFNLAISAAPLPAQPSAITGSLNPVPGSTQSYSVTNVGGVTYTWSFPAGWTINSGQGSNSVSVTVGATNGTISVTPSTGCGSGTDRTTTTTIPNYRAAITSVNYGSSQWCTGDSRSVSVVIQNTGIATWTNSSPDVNVGVKWNTNVGNWADYYYRQDGANLAPGNSTTYTFPSLQASNATAGGVTPSPPTYTGDLSTGTNNLTFDVVVEGICWFGGNSGGCGPGNSAFTTPAITILEKPIVNAGADQNICGNQVLSGTSNHEMMLLAETFEQVTAGSEIVAAVSGAHSWRLASLSGNVNTGDNRYYITNAGGGFACAINGNSIIMKDIPNNSNCDYFFNTTTNQVVYYNQIFNGAIYDNIKLRFDYSTGGHIISGTVYDYFQVVYSTNGGTTWTPVNAGTASGTYNNNLGVNNGYYSATQSTPANTVVNLPVNGQSFMIGFRWNNNGDNLGTITSMIIDNLYLTGEPTSVSWTPATGVTNANTFTPTITLPGTYTMTVTGGNGCSNSDQITITNPNPALTIGSVSSTNPTTCGANGTITINGATGGITNWFSNSFNTGTGLSLFGNAAVEDGRLVLTKGLTSQSGGIIVPNPNAFNSRVIKLEMDMFIGFGTSSPADGLSISYAGDIGSPTAGNEAGHGSGLVISFDTYSNGAAGYQSGGSNQPGIYLVYGGSVLQFSSGTTWRGTKQHVILTVNASNQLTLTVGGTVIFNNVSLPGGYSTAVNNTWRFAVSARTGGLFDQHSIDNLAVNAYNQIEYSVNGTTWQASNTFNVPDGVYTPQIRTHNFSGCVTTASNVTLTEPAKPSITVQVDECMGTTPANSYYVLAQASAGVLPYTFSGSPVIAVGNERVYDVAAGANYTVTVTDNLNCAASASVTTPSGNPTDIPFVFTIGNTVADCYDINLNRWVTFRDNTNRAIASIHDNINGGATNNNLGKVTVQVFKEATEPVIASSGYCNSFTDFKAMRRHFVISTANAPTEPVGVRLYFTADEADALRTATLANDVPGEDCTTDDNFGDNLSLTDLYVTKYSGLNVDGNYSNNQSQAAGGIYKVYGVDNALSTTPNGALDLHPAQFSSIFSGGPAYHYVQMQVNEFSEFWLHGSIHAAPLPVEMMYLQAEDINNSFIKLSWGTATEINNQGFEVQRSTDALSWNAIGWVDGHNNSTVQLHYDFDDHNVQPNIVYYYRLKQVDFDGHFEHTGMVSEMISLQATFSVSDFMPNPTMDNTTLVVTTSQPKQTEVKFYDVTGRLVRSTTHQLHVGGNQISFSLSDLASGTYTAIVTAGDKTLTKRLVIAR